MDNPIVIVGAGVIGLSVGWKLAAAGHSVVMFDRGDAGKEASWLSAGMLAPQTEMGFEDEAIYALGRESMNRWPTFVKDLEAASGMSVDYRTEGILHVADDRDAAEALQRQYEFQKGHGLDVQWLTGAAARDIEPFLAPRLPAAVYCKSDHQIDNRLLVEAIKVAFKKKGGVLHEFTSVKAIIPDEVNPAIILEDGSHVAAARVVLAAGAWSRQIGGIAPEAQPPVRPVKGQMLQLKMDLPFELTHVVWGPDCYIVPKSNGRLLLGATVEERGFDTSVTAGGLYKLLEAGWRIVPGIYDLEVTETWAGLRPGSRDNDPVIGEAEVPGVVYATGHYRNGILLIPVTAEEVTRLILKGETSEWLEPFSPKRFARATTR